ncbi:MAG: hypothetical protein CSA54_04490 [Gammaproteobacteria bacterium]|nr:MAG: hypothetical protein CSA54_04490 [Gammaproteobacteria bacterium]
MQHFLNIVNSTRASTARKWRGTSSRPYATAYPAQSLLLFDREGCAQCRFVREALSELDLDAVIYPRPEGGQRYAEKMQATVGTTVLPALFDPNSDTTLSGSAAIVDYLFTQYGQRQTPDALRPEGKNLQQSERVDALRKYAGTRACPAKAAKQLLILYGFESSPFSRLVRERLCELEIAYQLINLSKQKASDMGLAAMHLSLGKYQPLPNTKRADFLAAHGRVQVPFLQDPNTDTALFDSKAILAYLDKTYALGL